MGKKCRALLYYYAANLNGFGNRYLHHVQARFQRRGVDAQVRAGEGLSLGENYAASGIAQHHGSGAGRGAGQV